jgi:hypothetical protein
MDHFELRRQSDGLVYCFTRKDAHSFVRADNPALTIAWEGPWGWLARLPESGEVAGRPWEMLPAHQTQAYPPEGVWISRKDGRSHVYRLVHA